MTTKTAKGHCRISPVYRSTRSTPTISVTRESRLIMEMALTQLENDERKVIEHTIMANQGFRNISHLAAELHVTPGSIKHLQEMALVKLRKIMSTIKLPTMSSYFNAG